MFTLHAILPIRLGVVFMVEGECFVANVSLFTHYLFLAIDIAIVDVTWGNKQIKMAALAVVHTYRHLVLVLYDLRCMSTISNGAS